MQNVKLRRQHQELNFKIATLCDTIREQKVELEYNETLLDDLLKQRKDLGE